MKKYLIYILKYFAISAVIVVLLASCKNDFLEKPAGSDITIDTVFANSTNAEQMIFSLYHDKYFSPNNIPLSWWESEGYFSWSDLGEDMYFPSAGNWIKAWPYIDGTMNKNSGQLYSIANVFFPVRQANVFLQRVNTVPTISEEEENLLDNMKGEAHAHIAYQYFKGFRIWGSLPWINEALIGGEEAIPRAAFKDLIDSIVSRLDMAATLLPEKWESRYTGRFTKVAAKALKAKVLVYAASDLYNNVTPLYAANYEHPEVLGYGSYDVQRWQRAVDACKDAIDAAHASGHALYEDGGVQKNIYELALKRTKEHILYQTFKSYGIFNWQYTHNMMNYPHSIGQYTRSEVHFQPTFQHIDGYQLRNGIFPIQGYTNGDATVPIIDPDAKNAGYTDEKYFENRDYRFYQNIVYHGSKFGESYNSKLINFDINKSVSNRTHGDWEGFKSGFMVRKFVNEDLGESNSISYTPVHPIIRLADIYLLYAEALNRLNGGPTTEAITYLNLIRSRSGMPDYNANNYSGTNAEEQFQNAIKYERRVEFYLEGQRYFDLRRWKDGEDLQANLVGASIDNGVIERNDLNWINIWDDKLYFHPFHENWESKTPGLFQNPGY